MAKKYDLVIVGAGPGGAMAAKTAGENGLKTLVLERRTNPAVVQRGDSQIFASESHFSTSEKVRFFGERAYYNFNNQKIIFPVNGFSVDYDGPIRKIYAWHFYAPDGKTRIEFGNYEENFQKGRFFFTMDKARAIDLLLKDAVKDRVEVLTGVNVNGIEKTKGGIKVTGNGDSYEGTFVVGADGINSRIAQLMGFRDDQAEPMNESARQFTVMVPMSFLSSTLIALSSQLVDSSSNPLVESGPFKVDWVANPRVTWTDRFAVYRVDGETRPFIFQEELPVQVQILAEGSELEINENQHQYGVKAIHEAG